MPTFILPIGYAIPSLKADINECCHVGGPFRHPVEYQLERYTDPATRQRAMFKITQMCMAYASHLMKQFPELQSRIATATLAMQIEEVLVKEQRESAE